MEPSASRGPDGGWLGCDGAGLGALAGSASVTMHSLRRSKQGAVTPILRADGSRKKWPSRASVRSQSRNAWRATLRDPALCTSTQGHARRSQLWARLALLFRPRKTTAPNSNFRADSGGGRVALVQLRQQPGAAREGSLATQFGRDIRAPFPWRREGQCIRVTQTTSRGADITGVTLEATLLHDALGPDM